MTETMTDIQAFTRRFEYLDGWGIRISGRQGRLVEIDEYDVARELSTHGHFTYVSHDETSITVEVGLPDRDPYKEVVIPFAADRDEVERLLVSAIRECEKAEEALTSPESAAAGAWGEDAMTGENPVITLRRMRDSEGGMTLDQYQQAAAQFAIYPKERTFDYLALGLVGEAGEVAEKYKRVLRGDYPTIRSVRHDIIRELGDVLWYMAQWCNELDFSLEAVARNNLEKLTNRKRNKTLKGEGDNR